MAIIYNYNIRNLWCNAGILEAGTNWSSNPYRSTWGVTVLSGAQPSASTITSGWSSYNTAYLCHWQGVVIYQANGDTSGAAQGLALYSPTSTPNANDSGTASWAIMWPTNPSEATIQGSSLPSTQFIVVPVTDTAGNGVIRLASTSLTIGNPYSINDIVIIAGGGIA